MANGLDRLERLFSKRKSAPARDTTVSNINGNAPPAFAQPESDSPLLEVVFPPPSFIRPTANRMHARDEFELPSPISVGRTSSSDSARNSRRLSHLDSRDNREMNDTRRRSGPATTASFHLPSRTSSLLTRRHDRKPGGLIQLQLPGGTTSTNDPSCQSPQSPSADISSTSEDQKVAQRRLLEALPIYPAVKVETPPASDQDEFNFPSPPSSTRGRLPPAILSPFTPEPSPDMIPQRDSILSEPKTSSDIRRESVCTVPSRRTTLATISSAALLDDDWRDSYVQDPQVTVSPESASVFQEPKVQDFLALTSDDLAEFRTKAPTNPPLRLPPPPPVLPPSVRSPAFSPSRRGSNMLAPLAPDEVAAFQAARIAKKYDFDFLYVINFWPKDMNHLHRPSESANHPSIPSSVLSSPTSSVSKPPSILYSPTSECPTTKNSTPRHSLQAPSEADSSAASDFHVTDCCPESAGIGSPRPRPAVAGRLLAAYGLNTLDGPFRPGARAHRKILREGTDGWIEYRKTDAKENEFARGYARSYYTSTEEVSPRRASAPGGSTSNSSNCMAAAASASRLATQMEGAVAVRQSFSSAVGAVAGRARHSASGAARGAGAARRVSRGIVFAAYRRPRSHGGTVHSSRAELDALEKDAEALVDLVLDFHQDRRRWEVYQDARRASD